MSWKDETCETCEFRVGGFCHARPVLSGGFPSVMKDETEDLWASPQIFNTACAEHKPNQSKRKDG